MSFMSYDAIIFVHDTTIIAYSDVERIEFLSVCLCTSGYITSCATRKGLEWQLRAGKRLIRLCMQSDKSFPCSHQQCTVLLKFCDNRRHLEASMVVQADMRLPCAYTIKHILE